jgi:hypothetical protein
MFKQTDVIKRVVFNPSIVEHREAVYNFLSTGKWTKFFEIPKNCQNLPYHLMEEMLKYFQKAEKCS